MNVVYFDWRLGAAHSKRLSKKSFFKHVKNMKKGNFNQRLECAARKHWSKYTTRKGSKRNLYFFCHIKQVLLSEIGVLSNKLFRCSLRKLKTKNKILSLKFSLSWTFLTSKKFDYRCPTYLSYPV